MLQSIVQFFHANTLPIFMIIGTAGFVLCMVADHIKNKELKKIIEEGSNERPPVLSAKTRQKYIAFTIGGFILMIASMIALWMFGYFDRYLVMLGLA